MKCQLKIESDNIMNIRPLCDRIVGKRIEEQETTGRGIVIPDSAKEEPQEGEVAVGHGKRLQHGQLVALDVKLGDHKLFAKYSGSEIQLDGAEYIIMRQDNIFGILDSATPAARKAA